MTNRATEWERRYDSRTAEVVDAAAIVASEPKPRTWPVSGLNPTEFNPNGHDLSRRTEAKDPLGTKGNIER
jgi:hypothetical protein